MQVIDETAGAANKRPILDARIAASDVWRSTHPEMPFWLPYRLRWRASSWLAAATSAARCRHAGARMTAHSIVTPLALIVAAQLSTSVPMKVFR